MNPDLRSIWQRMQGLGLAALAHANRHSAYTPIENGHWPELSILQAAHAAELLIKARIAQEHPLLVFEDLPKPKTVDATLNVKRLFEDGKTIQWSDLPQRLWAATGTRLPNVEAFREFGRLRNGVQHFAPPSGTDAGALTLKFVFEVIDPFIHGAWGLCAVDYDEDHEPYLYFVGALVRHEILFHVSAEAAACFKDWDVEWDKVPAAYGDEMHRRVTAALEVR
jgi:hypothetical protein